MKFKNILTSTIILLGFKAFAQAPYWKLGGNPTIPPDAVNTTNNYIGTAAGNTTFMKIGVNGSQDILIDNNPAQLLPGNGGFNYVQGGHWIGLGRIFATTF